MRSVPFASGSAPALSSPSAKRTSRTWWTGCSRPAAGGGKAGTGLGPRSVRLTLGRLKAAFEMAVDEGRLVRNVVKLVTPPEYTPGEREIWSKSAVRRFLRTVTKDTMHAAWRLSLYGLRRGEVLGLRCRTLT